MNRVHALFTVVLLVGLLGCSDGKQGAAEKAAKQMQQSFDAAPEELKAKYQALKTAVENNEFAKAKAALDELNRSQAQLSPEQLGALLEQKQTLMLKAATAAQNGDKSAAALIQEMRSQSRSR